MKAADIAQRTVDELITRIEAGAGTWEMPWRMTAAAGMPHNATTGVAYRGGNIVALWMEQLIHGYATAQWATYRQWQGADRQVRKGSKGTHLIHWARKEIVADDGTVTERMVPNSFVVFHVEQTEYVGEHPELDELSLEPTEFVPEYFDLVLAAVPAQLAVGNPSYSPTFDRVMMPPRDAFDVSTDYQATLAHELVHWTGHESRLAREYGKRFGDQAYAVEELVAELGAAMLCGAHGVQPSARNDHAAYLQHWITVLRAEPMVLWQVAGAAQRAADMILDFHDHELLAQRDLAAAS
jgi:antirestriction protein ArdC